MIYHNTNDSYYLDDYQRGIILGLIIGEGSFSVSYNYPTFSIVMYERHLDFLIRIASWIPGSKLYGPYERWNRVGKALQLRVRGFYLKLLLDEFKDDIEELCPHVFNRLLMMEKYLVQDFYIK